MQPDRYVITRYVPIALCAGRMVVQLVGVAVTLLVLWRGAQAVFRPDAHDTLRQGDALFRVGRYHDALATYAALTEREPTLALAWARRGMVEALRDEVVRADRSLATALQLGLRGDDHDLARLYQGHIAVVAGRQAEAESMWATIADDVPLRPLRWMLEAELLVRAGDYAGAEVQYRAIPRDRLPDEWRALLRTRLAALRAATAPDAARALLTTDNRSPFPRLPSVVRGRSSVIALAAPLLPADNISEIALLAALRAEPAQRAQMLGQVYLSAGLYALAEAQFTIAAASSQHTREATAYAAYTRWRAGDRVGGVQRLERLVAAHPDDARARALLALMNVADDSRAQTQLDAIRALAPRAPDTHLAWAQWYAAQHDYVAAADAYKRALDDAAAEQRGVYALALARFSLDTDVQPCDSGLPAAAASVARLPADASAWATLAGLRFRCGDAAGAQLAARAALAHDPASPEAAYYLGRALAASGDRTGARAALVSAADLAPASTWRERAEKQIVVLGL